MGERSIVLRVMLPRTVRPFALAVCVLLLTSCATSENCAFPPIDDFSDVGTGEHVDPEVTEFLEGLLDSVRANPYSSNLRGRLAMGYEMNAFVDEALVAYAQASELDPYNAKWHYFSALLRGARGEYGLAIEHMDNAITADSSYVSSWMWRGTWALNLGHVDEALENFREAESLDTGSPATMGIALALLQQDKPEQAIDVLEPLGRQQPHPQVFRLLGEAYRETGRDEEARVAFAWGTDPQTMQWPDPLRSEKMKYARGFTKRLDYVRNLLAAGNRFDARKELEKLERLRPDDKALLLAKAEFHVKSDELRFAADSLNRGIDLYPNEYRFYSYLADVLRQVGQAERALELLNKSAELNDAEPTTHELMGRTYLQLERNADAINSFNKALSYGTPKRAELHLLVGVLEGQQEEWDKAIGHYTRAVELDPTQGRAHILLSEALTIKGRTEEAQGVLRWGHRLGVIRESPDHQSEDTDDDSE